MKEALRSIVVPALRKRGFSGSFPHFRRLGQNKTDLLSFQFDRHGGGFVVEIAEGPATEFMTSWGKRIPASSLTVPDLHPKERARLQPGGDGTVDSWYRYDAGLLPDAIASELERDLQQADAWWAGIKIQSRIRPFSGAV